METTTVIELFEELKKQIAALGRRLDDRNPPTPPTPSIPTEPDNRLDRLLETARHTRTNVERVRMELTDRISALEKKLGQERGRCAAETACATLPSPQRHIHTINFKSSKSTLCMFGLSLAVVCCGVHIHRLHTRIDSICDAEYIASGDTGLSNSDTKSDGKAKRGSNIDAKSDGIGQAEYFTGG